MFVEANDVPRVFAAELPAFLDQLFQDIAVADGRPCKRNADSRQRLFRTQVGHQRADHAAVQELVLLAELRNDEQQLVSVIEPAVLIRHGQAIAVAIEGHTQVRTMRFDRLGQHLRMRGAAIAVDVDSVRLHANGIDLGSQFVKHMRRDMVGSAVRAIHHQSQPAQVEIVGKSTLAEFDVAARRIVDATCLAQLH